MKLLFLAFLLIFHPAQTVCDNILQFIANYFVYKNVQLVTIYNCWSPTEIVKMNVILNAHSIRSSFIYLDTFLNHFDTINRSTNVVFYDVHGCFLDLQCPQSQDFLAMDANTNKWTTRFHNIYKWLLLSNFDTFHPSYFENVKLRMDSDILIANPMGDTVLLHSIYHQGQTGGQLIYKQSLIYKPLNEKFIKLDHSFYEERKNMSGMIIHSATVITKEFNTTPEEYLQDRKKSDRVNQLNYALFVHILAIHEFQNVLVLTSTWYGPSLIGIDGGLPKLLWYGEADVSATSGIMTPERVLGVDYLISTYTFGTCFIFRNPSAIGKVRNQFFDPFNKNAWYVCLLFWALLCIILKFTFNVHAMFGVADRERGSWSSNVLNTLAAFCQQDIETDAQNLTGRILILSLMLLSLMLYNYYTSSIVSDLINSQTQAFKTVGELVRSSMGLGMEDIAYTSRLFKTTKDSDIIYLRDHKILVPGKEPNYYLPEEGIARVKAGGFAYHVEPATGYPLIAKTFDGSEVCDLCEIYVFAKTLIYVLAQKRSQYRELFTISYTKMMERGIMRRESLIWQAQKPSCLSSANVLQIELEQVAPAFFVLLIGVVAAVVILLVEMKQSAFNSMKIKKNTKTTAQM